MSDIVDVNTMFGPLPAASNDLTVESLLALMHRHQVTSACTLSTLGMLIDETVGNAATRATCHEYTELRPVATMNPQAYFGDDTPLQALVTDGFCMVRFFPLIQGWPLDFEPFRALAIRLQEQTLPIMIDIANPGELTTLHGVLSEHRGAVIVAGAGMTTLAEAVAVLRKNPGWYLDTSQLLAPGSIRAAVDALGAERLLFGTRAPSVPVASAMHTLRQADLTDDALGMILAGNAQRLLQTAN